MRWKKRNEIQNIKKEYTAIASSGVSNRVNHSRKTKTDMFNDISLFYICCSIFQIKCTPQIGTLALYFGALYVHSFGHSLKIKLNLMVKVKQGKNYEKTFC